MRVFKGELRIVVYIRSNVYISYTSGLSAGAIALLWEFVKVRAGGGGV